MEHTVYAALNYVFHSNTKITRTDLSLRWEFQVWYLIMINTFITFQHDDPVDYSISLRQF